MAASAIGEPEPQAVCARASDAGAAIAVFYADGAAMRRERVEKAAELARACPSALIFLVGGARPHKGYFGARNMALELEGMGVASARVRTERNSFDTETNVLEMKSMAAAEGVVRLALVSDALHLLRIRAVFGDPAPGMELLFFPASGQAGLLRIVSRPNYEAAAWLGMLAPAPLRRFVFELTGRRGSVPG